MDHRTVLMWGLLALLAGTNVQADDGEDHPLLSRYPGFEIREQVIVEYDEGDILLGPLTEVDRDFSLEMRRLEGRVHNTQYQMRGADVSLLQLVRNYQSALKRLNAEVLYTCVRDACFDMPRSASGVYLANYLNKNGRFLHGILKRARGEIAILTARVVDGDRTTHLSLIVSADENNEVRNVNQTIIETAALETEKIAIGSAAEIERMMAAGGKAVLDGIYFDHDKATIREESRPTLAAIADYLQARTDERFFVVGHTDGTGAYDYNLALSKSRAEAVVEALRALGVGSSQVQAVGVGPVAPAGSNRSDAGLASNRRVELVERL